MSDTTDDFDSNDFDSDDDDFRFDGPDDPFGHLPPPGDSPLQPGKILLQRFLLRSPFKESGQSTVWAAWDLDIKRFVVLKFGHTRLTEEALLAAKMFGAVISLYEYNTTIPDNPFLVLEFALGGPISDLAKAWSDNPALLIEKFIPVIGTLADAHALGWYHCDLKPTNILLWKKPPDSPDGIMPKLPDPSDIDPSEFKMKVADWGLASGEGDDESGYGGTPGFAAPEQWIQRASPAADLFGLAATLYFLVTGKHVMPPTREFAAQLCDKKAVYTPPDPVHEINLKVGRRLSRIIQKSLQTDPKQRHRSAHDLAQELDHWLHGYSISEDSSTLRVGLWIRRNSLITLLLVLMLGVGVWGGVSEVRNARNRAEIAEKEFRIFQAKSLTREVEEKLIIFELNTTARATSTELTAAARAAARRGDWQNALKLFEQVIKINPAIATQLRVERLFGYFAINDENSLESELKALEAEENLGHLAAEVKLVHGAFMMCDTSRADEGRKLITESLELRKQIPDSERDELFPPADALYAEALLNTRPRPMIEKLKEAVKADSLHFPAHSALVIALLASGDPEAAARQADELARRFPESSVPAFVLATKAMIDERDRVKMRAGLDEFSKQACGKKAGADANRLFNYFDLFANVLDLLEEYYDNDGNLSLIQSLELKLKLREMRMSGAASLSPFAFPVPTVNMFVAWNQTNFEVIQQAISMSARNKGNIDEIGKKLTNLAKDYPEATIHTALVANRITGGTIAVMEDNPEESRQRMLETADVAYRAAKQPTLIPRSPAKYKAQFIGAIADIAILKLMPDALPLHIHRVQDGLPILIAEGRKKSLSKQRDAGVEITIRFMFSDPPNRIKAAWKLNTPAGKEAYRLRNRQLFVIGRNLLESWAEEVLMGPEKENKAIQTKIKEMRVGLEKWAKEKGVMDILIEEAPMPRLK